MIEERYEAGVQQPPMPTVFKDQQVTDTTPIPIQDSQQGGELVSPDIQPVPNNIITKKKTKTVTTKTCTAGATVDKPGHSSLDEVD